VPEKGTLSDFDRNKRGLQDDHDPNDIGQRQANKKGGIKPSDTTKQIPETPPDADSLGGGSQGGM
jgi:hypothetical protein